MRFEIVPFAGVGPVRLGMHRGEVSARMGLLPDEFRKTPSAAYTTDAFHDSCFQVFYAGTEPLVEYIELSRHSGFEAFFDGVDVFALSAVELVERLSRRAAFDVNDPELGYSYVFPEWELALWRPIVPENDSDADGRFFSTVGIGVRGYFSNSTG
jgi:hypothetical protein